jgi:putative ABC transport system permease protein
MRHIDRLRSRLDALVHGEERDRQMDDEVRFHLDMEAEKNRRLGLGPEDAHRQARVSFGGVEAVKEGCRDAWGVRLLQDFLRDVGYGLRSLRRSPGFAAVVVLTLGLGIGANTAMFSVVNTVLLQPLPYRDGESLMVLRQSAPGAGTCHLSASACDLGLSPLELQDFRAQAASLDVVEYHSMAFTLLGAGDPKRVQTGVVSWNFFKVLGVEPLLGRGFRAEDDTHGAEAVLLASHEFWQERLGADPGVVGRRFDMNGRVHTVIGVLPPLPRYPGEDDVYMPSVACPFRSRPTVVENREARMLQAFARVKNGVPVERAAAEVATVADRLRMAHPETYAQQTGYRADLLPLREELVRSARPTFLVLLGTVACVLLIACANVANLMVARLAGREKELAVRATLGAGRGRLLRQLLTESTLLSMGGGALGLALAAGVSNLLAVFAARFTPRASELRLDGSVFTFTFVMALLTGILAGSLPGFPSWRRLAAALVEGGRTSGGASRTRLRGTLVVAQLALSFVLLIGAALMLRSFARLREVETGFRSENVLTAEVHLNWARLFTAERRVDAPKINAFHDALHERVRSLPGVSQVALAWTIPLNSSFQHDGTFHIEGRPVEEDRRLPRAESRAAGPAYFETLGVPLVRGRGFLEQDRDNAPVVVVVSQSLARRHFGDEDPLGRRISSDGENWGTIVGVAGDVRNIALDQEPKDTIYLPFAQFPGVSCHYFIRTFTDPHTVARQFQEVAHSLDPDVALHDVKTLEEVRERALSSPRLTTVLLGVFAGLALSITAAGLSGLIAYSVSQRTHEIGIRMALGAEPRRVLAMVLSQGMRSVALGLGLGAVAALALARLVSGLLFGVAPTDALCFVGSGMLLVLVAALACLLPARRATSIDPQMALRSL